ncbi:Uncharacterized protein APZ42_019924 [Daphnia magna]|uniref:Type VII secretion system protein EssD-like domain-containing protein n=1 Tax=Daphnia magna TaxID=35525 RepID=A0A0P4ZUY7_9CRUS|nr:Uncharacterized protein APZ42_019924 [Daphnia magna]
MSLVEELLKAMEKLTKVISQILNEFEGPNGLIEEMKSYELKKNIAKTTGTVIGIAGVCLVPFTLGWSLAATAAGASVNLVTEFVDSTESHAFRERMKKHIDAYQEHCEVHEKLIKRLESDIHRLSSAQELDVQTALLYCALSAEANKLDKKMVKISDAEMINKRAHMAGLALTLQQTGKLATVKGVGTNRRRWRLVAVVVGGFVSAYETVTLFLDWNGTHPTIAGTEKVVEEFKTAQSSLNKRMKNIKKGVGMKSNKQGNSKKSQYEKIWQRDSADQDKEDVNEGSAGGGDDEKEPKKPTKDGKPEKKRNETKVIVDYDIILPDGRRILRVSAVVRPENLRQGSNTNNYNAKKWKKSFKLPGDYHAGHIIGRMLGGSGSDVNNLVLMHSRFNNSRFKCFEFKARDLLEQCQADNPNASVEARITVSIVFAPGGEVPFYITYGVLLVVDGVVENQGYAAGFVINCCANGPHNGPCDMHDDMQEDYMEEDYYYTDEY